MTAPVWVEEEWDTARFFDGNVVYRRVHASPTGGTIGWLCDTDDKTLFRWVLHRTWMNTEGDQYRHFLAILSDPLPEDEALATMYAVWRMRSAP